MKNGVCFLVCMVGYMWSDCTKLLEWINDIRFPRNCTLCNVPFIDYAFPFLKYAGYVYGDTPLFQPASRGGYQGTV